METTVKNLQHHFMHPWFLKMSGNYGTVLL